MTFKTKHGRINLSGKLRETKQHYIIKDRDTVHYLDKKNVRRIR